MPYIKTKVGEHDYHKPACAEYCKMGGEFCPFVKSGRTSVKGIVRWSDLADNANSTILSGKKSEQSTYTADYSKKDVGTFDSDQMNAELAAAGYTCWGDGSGFEYDNMSRNVIGNGSAMERIYDITNYGINHNVLQLSEWNAWIDKFQYDYRFGRVSDTNAECILFPNVDNPWMFTEYVYKGIGGDSEKCAMDIPDEYVVEPPLYDPNTLTLVNYDKLIDNKTIDYDGKYKDEDSCSAGGDSQKSYIKEFRKIINWGDLTTWSLSETNGNEGIRSAMNKDNGSANVYDAGIRLYRVRIPVQSVKWGEHGNIPPHTLDMTAPKDWLDPTATVTKMKAVYDAVVGATIDSPYDGKIVWGNVQDENGKDVSGQQGRQAYVYVDMTLTGVSSSDGTYIEYYKYTGGSKTAIDMPMESSNGTMKVMKPARKIMPDDSHGEYCHGGCANLIGLGDKLQCKLMINNNFNYKNYFNASRCLHRGSYGGTGSACGMYVASREHPQIASYQSTRTGVHQTMISDLKTGAGLGLFGSIGGLSGSYVGASYAAVAVADYFVNLANRGEEEISYVVRYEPVMAGNSLAQLNKKKYNEFGKGVQIVPGTGKYAFDSEENANPFSGGDTNVYNDINTLSFHRFFASVMHCSSQKYCNGISGMNQQQGFDITQRAGGDGSCRYYKDYNAGSQGCPYNCAPKRAIEFGNCANAISKVVMTYMSSFNYYASIYAIFEYPPNKIALLPENAWSIEKKGDYTWCKMGGFAVAVCPGNENAVVLAVDLSDEKSTSNIDYCSSLGGAAVIYDKDAPSGHMIFCKFSVASKAMTFPNMTKEHDEENTLEGKVYTASSGFYWFQPLYNDGTKIETPSASIIPGLRQHVDENGYWFCKAGFEYGVPASNCVMIDNEDKFIGGWHPEYKDYSKIGSEFMQDIVSDDSREGQGMGDNVHTGDYTPIPQTVNKKGYWIDQSGVYITDERSTGIDEKIATDDDREGTGGGAVCISFRKSNTEVNGTTGKKIPPKTTNGAVFSNDPYALIVTTFRGEKKKDANGQLTGRPMFEDPETGAKYLASLTINNPMLLPTMRHAQYCNNCDYYIPARYHDITTCPWCGETYTYITGDEGTGMDAGSEWDKDASVIRKFFKIYAIGNADVWAPPGTAIKTDAYFWRHQAQITNGIRRQIQHRLGDSNKNAEAISVGDGKETGGCYQFNKMTAQSEMTLGYPEGLGKFIRIPEGAEKDATRAHMRYSTQYISWKGDQDGCVDGMYNPIMPRHMIPGWYNDSDSGEEDEGVIAPYTSSSNDALKMASYDQMRAFRNSIEPMYAYVLDYSYSGDYPTYRASYDQREKQDQPIIWEGRRSVISPSILACTDDGRDSYQTYFSGDYVYGNVREYFPSGYTWWMMHEVLGGRYTDNKGGWYHMDDGGSVGNGRMCGGSGGEYTCQNRTVAKCALSIYGMLPLDKDIVKAYIIISPDGTDPSKDPVGRSWTGGPVMYCHYHAKTKMHKSKEWGMNGDQATGDGQLMHLHGTAGYPSGTYFDEDGNCVNTDPGTVRYSSDDIKFQDYSMYALWGKNSNRIIDDRGLYYDDHFASMIAGIPGLHDTEFYRNVGTAKAVVKAYDDDSEVLGYGYCGSSFGDVAGFTTYSLDNTDVKKKQKFQYIVVNDDGDIVQKYPDGMMWKTDTTEKIESDIENHMATVELKVSDGTLENTKSYTFRQADSYLYQEEMPKQSQEITGYFDMSWANTRGYVYDEYTVEKSNGTDWNAPVIFQGDEASVNTTYTGGGESGQIGEVPRCMDITSVVRKMYNTRIDREFSATAGCTFETLKKWRYYDPLDKGAMDDDVKIQNNCIHDGDYYLLNDTITYPELDDDIELVPEIDPDGNKYELDEKTIIMYIQLPSVFEIKEDNCRFQINTDKGIHGDQITLGTYNVLTDSEAIIKEIKSMFESNDVERISLNVIKVEIRSSSKITIAECDNSCYSTLNITPGITRYAIQNRIIQVTSSYGGYDPTSLMGGGDSYEHTSSMWVFSSLKKSVQSFTVDLLRAPLCQWERDWRYEEGTKDYSSVKCPSEGCTAHTLGCSVAANKANKYYNSSSSSCPICGASLKDQPGITSVPGDGILTYRYDAPFSPNPFIKKIVIKPHEFYHTNYSVMVKADGQDSWQSLLSVEYHNDGYYMNYPEQKSIGGSDAVSISIDRTIRGRYVKVECSAASPYNVFHSYNASKSGDSVYQCVIHGDFSNFGNISLEGVSVQFTDEWVNEFPAYNEEYSAKIMSAQIIDNIKSKMRISFNKSVYKDGKLIGSYVNFSVREYTGGISQFEVYGLHYKTEESDDAENDSGSGKKYLSMTGMEDEFRWQMSTNKTIYSMPEPPTQILSITAGRDDAAGIVLEESKDASSLMWTTSAETITLDVLENGEYVPKEFTYKKITGGNYFYNQFTGKITIPLYDQDGVPSSNFEKNLSGTNFIGTYLPDTLTMRYWSGNGKSITFKARACGHGPSYMVEKNAIQVISSETMSKLPANGKSCKMVGIDGGEVVDHDIPWICYNNRPATLPIEKQSTSNSIQGTVSWNAGEFRKPSFTGKEIHDKLNDDQAFVDLFGKHCEQCYGQCETEVTLTGAPNQIISGDLKFIAKAYTERSVYVGGKTVKYGERTGGIDNGIIIVSCAPTSSGGGRMTLCYSNPQILIYAKEAKLFSI